MQNRSPQILADVQIAKNHIHKAIAMVEAGNSGIVILRQINAAKIALSEANTKIVNSQIENCKKSILKSKLPEERKDTVQRLIDLFSIIN